MASLHKVKQHGRMIYRVSFYDKNGERRFIRLGEMAKKAADSIALHVQQLADLSYAGLAPDAEQTAWLAKVGRDLAEKLAGVGLIAKREQVVPATLGEFLDGHIATLIVKPSTKCNLKQSRDYLVNDLGRIAT